MTFSIKQMVAAVGRRARTARQWPDWGPDLLASRPVRFAHCWPGSAFLGREASSPTRSPAPIRPLSGPVPFVRPSLSVELPGWVTCTPGSLSLWGELLLWGLFIHVTPALFSRAARSVPRMGYRAASLCRAAFLHEAPHEQADSPPAGRGSRQWPERVG